MSGERAGARKVFLIDLSTARTGKEYKALGRYIKIADASDASAAVNIAVEENIPSSFMTLKKNGSIVERDGFGRFFVTNAAQAGKTITLIVSEGPEDFDVDNPALTVDSLGSIDAPVDISVSDTITTTEDDSVAAATTEQVLAANALRKEVLITNLFTNTDPVRVGDSNAGAARGIELSPGQSITLETTAAIYVYNTKAGGAQSVAILELS